MLNTGKEWAQLYVSGQEEPPEKSIRKITVWKDLDVVIFILFFFFFLKKLRIRKSSWNILIFAYQHFPYQHALLLSLAWRFQWLPYRVKNDQWLILSVKTWCAVCCWTSVCVSEFSCRLKDWIPSFPLPSTLSLQGRQTEAHVWLI